MNLDIIYKDFDIVVVNKGAGVLAVPGRGVDKQDCIVNRLKDIFDDCIEQPSVHRLDMDTSGLMVLALTTESHRNISIQFQEKLVEKKYIAIVDGKIKENSGKIELAFRLDPENRPYQIYDPVQGKLGVSMWQKIGTENNQTRIEFRPITGRTHQLRIHSAHPLGLNAPIVGDRLYGIRKKQQDRMLLHATYLAFKHPVSDNLMEFTSDAPF